MDLYDTIFVPCPKCRQRREFQTKSGPCKLMSYSLEYAPIEALFNINREAPKNCTRCGTWFQVNIELRKPVIVTD